MKLSYSTRWLLCWALFIVALLALIAGVFAFSVNWRQGLGLCLVGIGIAGPVLWWLRHAGRKTRGPWMKTSVYLGITVLIGGLLVLPWNNFVAVPGGGEAVATQNGQQPTSAQESVTTSPPSMQTSTTSSEPTGATTSTSEPSLSEVEPETTAETTVTVTDVETVFPPRATITELAPPSPALQQNSTPDPTHQGIPTTSVTPEQTEPTPTAEPTMITPSRPASAEEDQSHDGHSSERQQPPENDKTGEGADDSTGQPIHGNDRDTPPNMADRIQ